MGIRFKCQHCGRHLNVKEHLAGKRGICPSCGGRFDIPGGPGAPPAPGAARVAPSQTPNPASDATVEAVVVDAASISAISSLAAAQEPAAAQVTSAVIAPVAATMPDPIAEAPEMQWFVAPAGSTTQFGPARGDLFRSWIAEGRVAPDSMVWREGWPEWRPAATVLPQLQATSLPPHAPAPVEAPAKRPAWSADPLGPHDVPETPKNPASAAAAVRVPPQRGVPKSVWIMIGVLAALVVLLIVVVSMNR